MRAEWTLGVLGSWLIPGPANSPSVGPCPGSPLSPLCPRWPRRDDPQDRAEPVSAPPRRPLQRTALALADGPPSPPASPAHPREAGRSLGFLSLSESPCPACPPHGDPSTLPLSPNCPPGLLSSGTPSLDPQGWAARPPVCPPPRDSHTHPEGTRHCSCAWVRTIVCEWSVPSGLSAPRGQAPGYFPYLWSQRHMEASVNGWMMDGTRCGGKKEEGAEG